MPLIESTNGHQHRSLPNHMPVADNAGITSSRMRSGDPKSSMTWSGDDEGWTTFVTHT
jgi:hypothetical protein